MQPQPVFLEHWLLSAAGAAFSHPPAPPPARAILQAWADLRAPSQPPDRVLSALTTLSSSLPSLHVADPQAKLLILLLSSSPAPLSLPHIYSLLYSWLRKSPRPSPHLLSTAAAALLSSPPPPSSACPQFLLLLGALSYAPALPPPSRASCLELLCRTLEECRLVIVSSEELVLAAIGYGLSRSDDARFTRILGLLLGIWGAVDRPEPSLKNGLMIMRLVEWVTMGFINSGALDRIEMICGEIAPEKCGARCYARFAVVMAATGVLRAFRMASSGSRSDLDARLRSSAESTIFFIATYVVSSVESGRNSDLSTENRVLLQCMALGLARCGPVSPSASVVCCLCLALLNEIFLLRSFFRVVTKDPNGSSGELGISIAKEHLSSVLFKEAGAVTGVLCNQYGSADEGSKALVERYMWQYSRELYKNLRTAALVLRGRNNELLGNMEKIAEAAFLMVVMFAAEVAKHKLKPMSSHGVQPDAAVEILVAFSCVECLRRVRLPEYTDAVRQSILTIQENAACTASFVESMPPYVEVTNQNGTFAFGGVRYIWSDDEVQTARILFYLRVIPTCISVVPASLFGKLVVSTMFLYMVHPNVKVARASHSVFAAFVSSGKDSEQDDRTALKEHLVFYYIQSALEAYPKITPFEGLASGVAAVVRHLPAGSPAIFYSVHCIADKAKILCSKAMSQDTNMWKTWEENSDSCKKIIEMLLRLISLVDIQVLPHLLQQSAEFIIQLPKDGQNVLLNEMYSQVAESDDVTRKPVLVSWLQSLSYVCSQKKTLNSYSVTSTSSELGINSLSPRANLNLASSMARL